MKKNIFFLIVAITALTITAFFIFKKSRDNPYESQIKALRSENKTIRNKNNELVSEKLAFVGEKEQLHAQLRHLEKTGDTLRSKYNRAINQVVFLKKVIEINGTGDVITFQTDTEYVVGPTVIDTPLFAIDTADRFHSFQFAGNLKKYAYHVKVFDKTELVTESTKKGTLVRVVNNNPHVSDSEANSVLVADKKPSALKKGIWVALGAAVVLILNH